jgi:GNAT superfamily N-acetyltransferase
MRAAEPRIEVASHAALQPLLQQFWQQAIAREPAVAGLRGAAAMEALSLHAVARGEDGGVLGIGHITPDHRLGPLLVAPDARSRGIGQALLAQLVGTARQQQRPMLTLDAPTALQAFFARQGFIPSGDLHERDGVACQPLRRAFDGALAIEDLAQATAACIGVAAGTRRTLRIYSRELDPGLLDQPAIVHPIRRLCTGTRDAMVQILLHDTLAPQRTMAPLINLSQRLPSRFALRQVNDPVDLGYPSAYLVNDRGGHYFRPLGHRLEGEADMDGGGRARQLRDMFASVWERARPCAELRALGL